MMARRMKVILFVLFIHIVKNEIIILKNDSVCVNNECTTIADELSDKTFESTTDIDKLDEFFTLEENEGGMATEKDFQNINNGPKLISGNVGLQDEFSNHKLPKSLVPNNSVNKNISPLLKGDMDINDGHLQDEPKIENKTESVSVDSTNAGITTTETPKQEAVNNTNTNMTKDIYQNRHPQSKNQSEICPCDLKVNDCDINCCCDRDCNANMKTVFTSCLHSTNKVPSQFCFSSKSIFKTNLEIDTNGNGLFCVVRNNFHPYVKFREEMIINNVTNFNKRISRKKFFSYSPLQLEIPKMQKISYRFGDFLWAFSDNKTSPFGIPMQGINMQCKSKQRILYLTDYEAECLHSVPENKEKCLIASHLEMDYFLRHKIIKSPALFITVNSTDKVCDNKTCVEITPYTCRQDSDISSCVKSSAKRLQWENSCRNIASSVEYHIYHNGTDGVKEARAYFTLKTFLKGSFLQRIKLKFLWSKSPIQVFERSGNPGYIIGKPIISGRKIYSNNETMPLRKEAIELSYNPEDWLTVVGSRAGVCSPRIRRPIGFGENSRHSCFVELDKFDYRKSKCVDLQESFFQLFLGSDYGEMKSNNNLNKFVATFGNSEVENTGDWVQVIVDGHSGISGQVTSASNSGNVACKNLVTDLFIDVAYSKVGSIDKPQNKILGVHYYFGSPKNYVYYNRLNFTGFGSGRNVKLSTYVHFIDLTHEARAEFAETPGFEAKLPHDFFYPFFSGSSTHSVNFVCVFVALTFVFEIGKLLI